MFLSKLFKHTRVKALAVLAGLSMVAGVFACISPTFIRQQENAIQVQAATASSDTPLIISCYDNAKNAFENCTIAVEYYWDNYSYTLAADVIGNQLRSVTLPSGTKGFNLYRMKNDKAGYLPYKGSPGSGDYYNSYNYSYSTIWNQVIFTDSSLNRTTGTCGRPILAKGSTITFDATAFGNWFDSGALPSIYLYCNNYYACWAWWKAMDRIGSSQFMTFTADINYVVDGFIITRDNPSGTRGTGSHSYGENTAIWNRTTDITICQTGGLVCCLNTKTGDYYNWKGTTTDEDYAEMWGSNFLAYATCDGDGNVSFTADDWTYTETIYNSLTTAQQGIVWNAVGSLAGSTNLETAIYRYDYIVLYKKRSFSDYINRKDSPNKTTDFHGAFIIPGAPAGNESPLTMTLWIVLGAGILGLGAIGTAYFVSKKKKRHQA